MKKYSVLIVDDEPLSRRVLKNYCEQSRFFDLVQEARDGVEALSILVENSFDLLLLDIHMPMLTGLQLAKSITPATKVIFVTAYAEHAVEAFEVNAIDYLMKPVSFERFMRAIQKLSSKTQEKALTNEHTVILKQGRKTIRLPVDDILYCEAKSNNIRIYLTNQVTTDFYMPLKKLIEQLPVEGFTQVHRSFIINKSKVTAVENNLIHLGNYRVPVGKNFKPVLTTLIR